MPVSVAKSGGNRTIRKWPNVLRLIVQKTVASCRLRKCLYSFLIVPTFKFLILHWFLFNRSGIGWFRCPSCERTFAGFARGNVKSPCHRCKIDLLPEFIIEGDNARNEKKPTKDKHSCEKCDGEGNCPVVDEIKEKRLQRLRQQQQNDEQLNDISRRMGKLRIGR